MFGQLKENIFYSFELVKENPDKLKKKFNTYFETLKGSKELKTLHELYEMVESAEFDNESIALQFIDEVLNKHNSFRDTIRGKKSDLSKLTPLVNEVNSVKISDKVKALDILLFKENLNLKEKFDAKTLLIKQLTKATEKKVDVKKMLQQLDKKVTTSVANLTLEQKEALELFMENDAVKINDYFNKILTETSEKIDTKSLTVESLEVYKSLIAAKMKLANYKTKTPTIELVESIIELNEALND